MDFYIEKQAQKWVIWFRGSSSPTKEKTNPKNQTLKAQAEREQQLLFNLKIEMMIQMHKPMVPGQACLTSARVVPNPNKAPAGSAAGCLVNVVGNIFIYSPPPKLVVAATTPISIPIPIQRRRRLMATSNANADMANNDNNIWPCIPSSSYGDPCLDLFFNALRPKYRDANPCLKHLEQLLHLAWSHDPLTTLKLIFTFDSIYFSDRKFDTAVLWLHHNHPQTLLHNLHSVANLPIVRYCRDSWYNLVQIVYNVLVQKRDDQNHHDVAAHLLRLHPERYDRDPDYRLLHDRVIDVFVERLKSDINKMNTHLLVSGAAECCTSTRVCDKHRADAIFLRESISRRVSPPESDESGEEFLVPLTNYYKRQQEQCRVKKYLEKVKAAAAAGGNLSGGIDIIKPDALLPNEIISYVEHEDVREAAEIQWKAMVDLYLKQQQQGEGLGKFKNWLVVGHYPREFWEVGLRLLVSELSEEPWKGKLIGGEDEPHWIQGDHDLKSKYELAWKSECSVLGAIDLILEVGVNMNLKVEQMIKEVIVFTELKPPDTSTTWEFQYEFLRCEFEAIQSKFKDKGYGDDVVPHILYWHISNDEDSWICTQHSGFTLLSGGSDNLIKSFLHNGGEIGPHHLMEAAIAYKEYQTFVVVD